jgi:ABC-type amino acid transport substrate-binding protein
MARIQILELPTEHHGDDMVTPFVLVIDQWPDVPVDEPAVIAAWKKMAEDAGARTVILTEDTVDIPANTVTLDDGHVVRLKVEPDLSGFEDDVAKAIAAARQKIGLYLGEQRIDGA